MDDPVLNNEYFSFGNKFKDAERVRRRITLNQKLDKEEAVFFSAFIVSFFGKTKALIEEYNKIKQSLKEKDEELKISNDKLKKLEKEKEKFESQKNKLIEKIRSLSE